MRELPRLEFAGSDPDVPPDDHLPLTAGLCVRVGVLAAIALSTFSTAMLGVGIAVTLVAERNPPEALQLLLAIPVVIAGYLAAGVLGGLAFWAITPLRRWVIGWVLTGILVAGAVYGSVTVTAAVAYVLTGLDLIGFESPADAWETVRGTTPILALAAGIPGGLWYWWKDRQVSRARARNRGSAAR